MADDSSSRRVARRSFLTGVAGAAGVALLPTAGGATDSFGPRSRLNIGGAKEAVVDESGEVVYVATTDGFATVDVSDPANPTVLASRKGLMGDTKDVPLYQIYDLSVSGDRLIVGGPANFETSLMGFAVYDVSDPANPERTNFYRSGYPLHNVFLEGDIAYLTANGVFGRPVTMIDVSVDEPEQVGKFTPVDYDFFPSTIHDMYVAGDRMYACYWDLGTWVVDVSDPTDPDAIVRLGYDLDTNVDTSTNEMPGNSHYAQPHPEKEVLAVGKEAFEDAATEIDGAPGGVELWDISDPANATRTYVIAPPDNTDRLSTAHNFGWRGDRLYVAWYHEGVTVYDVADPAQPMVVAHWADPDEADFWTAKPIHDGFAATSYDDIEGADEPDAKASAALFTFPEPSGDDPTPAPKFDTFAPPASTADLPEPTPTPTATPTPSPTPTPSDGTPTGGAGTPTGGAGTPTGDTGATSTDAGSNTTGSSPGFGLLTTGAAGTLAGWRLLRNRRDADE